MISNLKSKLGSSAVTIGGWLTTANPIVAEAMATCKFDWICIDMEHGPVVETDAPTIFMALERHGVTPIVRLPSADPYLARRLLDLGADGFIVPVVESAAAFRDFAKHCLYPPAGQRGVGLSRVHKWGDSFNDYLPGFQPVLVPQIETRNGAEAAVEIASLKCVDTLFIGPYDLSADLGDPGNFKTRSYIDMINAIKEACVIANKAPGIHQVEPNLDQLTAKCRAGYRFIAFGTDMIAMRHAFKGIADIEK